MYRRYKRENITRKILEVEAQLQAEGLAEDEYGDELDEHGGTLKRPDRRKKDLNSVLCYYN